MDCFFDYELPASRIAQRPIDGDLGRAAAKMLFCKFFNFDSTTEFELVDSTFSHLPSILRPGDLLIANNSSVMPVRLFANLATPPLTNINANHGANAHRQGIFEILLIRKIRDNVLDINLTDRADVAIQSETWLCLIRGRRKLRLGDELEVGKRLGIIVGGRSNRTNANISDGKFNEVVLYVKHNTCIANSVDVSSLISQFGSMPIPPYIRRGIGDERDKTDYQTIFATISGSIAAPTAGLHFTKALLDRLKSSKIQINQITLHVGPASFLPIISPDNHKMLSEAYTIEQDTWKQILQVKQNGGRVIAIGTTATRTLETAATTNKLYGESDLFIQPGYRFQIIDGLITNFHQPKTTHLLLVSAFIGGENTRKVYKHALASEYRFLSYGDGSLLLKEGEGSGQQ